MTDYVRKVDIVKDSANVAGRKKIVYVDASSSTTVPAGSKETITIQPPAGKIWKVIDWVFVTYDVPNSAQGDHSVYLILSHQYKWVIFGRASYNKALKFEGVWSFADLEKRPVEESAQRILLQGIKFSNEHSIQILYENNTDADQTNPRAIRLLLEEEDEAT